MEKANEKHVVDSLDNRETFGTRLGFVLASIGGAVGLGNVWKFPYLVGRHGGAAFIVIYLGALFLVGIPILMTEFAIGRKTKSSYTTALKKLLPGKSWYLLGIIGVITLTITLAFYAGVAGWTMAYIWKTISGEYFGMSPDQVGGMFGQFISSPTQTVFWLAAMMLVTLVIVTKGIKQGIEKVCNILLPTLFIMIIILGVRSVLLPGAGAGLEFYLKPNFANVTSAVVIAAIGQAFFSLGVGSGNLVVYGSYLDKRKTIGSSTIMVALGDTLAAILFGFIIFPAASSFGLEAGMGPPLVFITLPVIFAQMKYGVIFATIFFISLFFACLTSTICILEAIVGFVVDEYKFNRKKATYIMSSIVFVLGIFMMLSFGPLSNFLIFGNTIFDFSNDVLVSTILLPLGGLLMVLLVGWIMKPNDILEEINIGEGIKINKYYMITVKYIAPLAVGAMFISMIQSFI